MLSLVVMAVLVGCSTATAIYSDPPGAVVYADGEKIGTTPVTHHFSAFEWNQPYELKFVLDGYYDELHILRRVQKGLLGMGDLDWPETVMVRLKKK